MLMPPHLMAQARFVLHEEVSPEQVDGLLKEISGFRTSMDEAQKTFARMPLILAQEREAVFKEIDKLSPALNKTHTLTQAAQAALESFGQIEAQ